MASVVGLALGPYTAGKVADVFVMQGSTTAEALGLSLSVLCVVFILSLILLLIAMKYLPNEESGKYERARALGEIC
jgi:uncharacterized protein HemY